MLKKHNLKYFLLAIYLFHFTVSQFFLPALSTHSIFPFYNWNLFSYMPRFFNDWHFIKIHSIDNRELQRPLIYSLHRKLLKPKKSWLLRDQISHLGYVIKNERTNLIKARKQLEQNLFYHHKTATYEIIKGNIDIRNIAETGEIQNLQSLAQFKYRNHDKK